MNSTNSASAQNVTVRDTALIDEIKSLHNEICLTAEATLTKALKTGELLLQLKKQCGHSNWLHFVNENLPFSDRTARNYMRLASKKDQLADAALASEQMLTSAYRKLAKPRASGSRSRGGGKSKDTTVIDVPSETERLAPDQSAVIPPAPTGELTESVQKPEDCSDTSPLSPGEQEILPALNTKITGKHDFVAINVWDDPQADTVLHVIDLICAKECSIVILAQAERIPVIAHKCGRFMRLQACMGLVEEIPTSGSPMRTAFVFYKGHPVQGRQFQSMLFQTHEKSWASVIHKYVCTALGLGAPRKPVLLSSTTLRGLK